MPTVVSLFAGIGGFDLGLERAGFTVVGQCELDPFCARVLTTRWPSIARAADVRGMARELRGERDQGRPRAGSTEWSEPLVPVDLLVGGFPCQDLSVAGKRAGLGGERSGLFWEIVRIARAVTPTWGLFENVPGLVSSHRGRDLEAVLAGLRECWPVVGYRILDSRYFGVAQRRRRIFFVCGPTEDGVAQVLALAEGGAGDSPAGGEAGADIARCLATGTNAARWDGEPETCVTALRHLGSGGPDDNEAQGEHLVVGALPALDTPHGHGFAGFACDQSVDAGHIIAAPLSAGSHAQSHMPGRRREDDENLVTSFNWQSGGDVRLGVKEEQVDALHAGQTPAITHSLSAEGHDASEDGTGRGTPLVAYTVHAQNANVKVRHAFEDDQTRTLDGMSGPDRNQGGTAIVGAASVRRLTPVECERLQGFPDGWTCLCTPLEAYAADPDAAALACTCPDSPRYRALGNAVTVNVIHWLGGRLMAAMRCAPA